MTIRNILFAVGVLVASALVPSMAAEQPEEVPEEEVDEGLKNFGYLAGLARGCVSDAQQTELEREVIDIHGGIGRLLGTDRAFLFAAAFGYGTAMVTKTEECQAVLSRYEGSVESFRAGRRGQ